MQVALSVISAILILASFLPLVHNDYWVFKILEYPRVQKLVLILAALAGWLSFMPVDDTLNKILLIGLGCSALYLIYKILPYTILTQKEMKYASDYQNDDSIRIFAANVFQDNKEYEKLLNQIKQTAPDIIFLLETNGEWTSAIQSLKNDYPYSLHEPLENTYGLNLFSKLPFDKAQVAYLVKDDIPSIDVVLKLRSGRKVQIWGLHPEPPVPNENLYSTAKDKELMKIALKARECTMPCIVLGDLNDVAWSHTTTLFRKTSSLLDPRRGRGFYSTFSAHHWYLRFPLDYVFCSKEFGLVQMKRLPKNGSDHFATFTHLAYLKDKRGQHEPEADTKELQEAKEISQKHVDQD